MEQRKLKENWEEIYHVIHCKRLNEDMPTTTLYKKHIDLLNSMETIPCIGLDEDGDMEMCIIEISELSKNSFLYGECFE